MDRQGPSPAKKKKYKSHGKQQAIEQTAKLRRKLMAEQVASGLSMAEFCKQNGIAKSNFSRWRRDAAEEALKASHKVVDSQSGTNPFVAVRVSVPKASASTQPVVEVVLPAGSKIRVTEQTPLELLSKVLKALEGKC